MPEQRSEGAKMGSQSIAADVRRALETGRLSFDSAGIVLFGSAVAGQAGSDSDIDLLVVGRNITPRRHRFH